MKKLRFGLPVGSLNHPDRWSTKALLDDADLYTSGYEPGSRKYSPKFTGYVKTGDVALEAVAVRPQLVPAELCRKDKLALDIAITGSDWAKEGMLRGYDMQKLCDLGYGDVDIVLAFYKNLDAADLSELLKLKKNERRKEDRILWCYTEYTSTAKELFLNNDTYKELYGDEAPYIMIKGNNIGGKNDQVQIWDSEGTTELAGPSGFGNIIIENTQTGTTISSNDYNVVDKLYTSVAGLYTGPHIMEDMEDQWKYEEAQIIKIALEGAALAKNYGYYEVDVPYPRETEVFDYINKEKLFAKEAIKSYGNIYIETRLLIPKKRAHSIRRELLKRGAKSMLTTPIKSVTILNDDENNHNP